MSDFDPAQVAATLRSCDTVPDGANYLDGLRPSKDDLVALVQALGVTRTNGLTKTDLRDRALRQAIGARRKYDGLRSW